MTGADPPGFSMVDAAEKIADGGRGNRMWSPSGLGIPIGSARAIRVLGQGVRCGVLAPAPQCTLGEKTQEPGWLRQGRRRGRSHKAPPSRLMRHLSLLATRLGDGCEDRLTNSDRVQHGRIRSVSVT